MKCVRPVFTLFDLPCDPNLSCVLFLALPGLPLSYPEGSVLLDTRLRNGEVSEDARDVVHGVDWFGPFWGGCCTML